MRFAICSSVLMGLAVFAAPLASGAGGSHPGSLDPSFGRDGKVVVTVPPAPAAEARFRAVAIENDGDVILESAWETGQGTFRRIERRSADGELDPSFGEGGEASVVEGQGLAPGADGKLLVGVQECGEGEGSLILLNSSGAKDESFGQGGCAPLKFTPESIVPEADGSVLVAGSKRSCPCGKGAVERRESVLAKLLPNGRLDVRFGSGGYFHLGRFGEDAKASPAPTSIAPTPDGGALVAVGVYVLRLTAAGTLDPAFASGGKLRQVERGGGETRAFHPVDLLALASGKTVVASRVSEANSGKDEEIVLSRLLANGGLDPSFGTMGNVQTHLAASGTVEPVVAAMPGEGILISGTSSRDSVPVLVRFGPRGELDPSYGNGGVVSLSSPEVDNPVFGSLATAADGSALVAGTGEGALVLGRAPNGAPNPSFGQSGTLTEPRLEPVGLEYPSLAIRPDGGFMVAAEAGSLGPGRTLIGFSRNGRQEPGPNGSGVVRSRVTGSIQSVTGGLAFVPEGQSVLRAVDSAGKPLLDYGAKGVVRLPARLRVARIETAPNGGLALVGTIGRQRAMGVFRVDAMGRPIAGFGRRGLAEVSFGQRAASAEAALVEPGGKVVLTGSASGHVAVARLLPDGRLDRGFGHQGRVRGLLPRHSYGSQISPLGKGVVVASVGEKLPRRLTGIIRLDRSGRLVRGFGSGGVVVPKDAVPPLGLFTGGGRIVSVTANPGGGVSLRALRGDGGPDRSFGRGGTVVAAGHQPNRFLPTAAIQQFGGAIVVAGFTAEGSRRGKANPSRIELLRFR